METFIPPDCLDPSSWRTNLQKVVGAIRCAAREGARIATLGGFTSIVMERRRGQLRPEGIALTTGNTLTVGFIVRGVERAASRLGIDLTEASVLVLGSTGDLGSGSTSYFARRARELLLCARRGPRLQEQAERLSGARAKIRFSTDAEELLSFADVVISVASLAQAGFELDLCRPGTLVCDAGYPKNLTGTTRPSLHVFWGGMGQARRGWTTDSGVGDSFYRFAAPGIAHGCMLEGMVLGLEARYEPFSRGRGNITEARMEEILGMAERHDIVLAPLFNGEGLWPDGGDLV